MTRGFSFFEEALLVVEAQDQNIEWYMKVAAATQNAIQCYMSSKMRKKKKKKMLLRNHWIIFPRGQMELNLGRNHSVPSMSDVSKFAVCPSSHIADDPSALPSSTSSGPSSQ